jgi:hypothetical protein
MLFKPFIQETIKFMASRNKNQKYRPNLIFIKKNLLKF